MPDPGLADLEALTLATYERNADRFARERSTELFERAWLERFLEHVPHGGHVLDLGCGTGDPIARHLIDAGRRVTGVDGAAAMLAIARERLPRGRWLHQDMRRLEFDGPCHGIVGWHSVFHLTQDDQRALLPRLCALLTPGGALLLTVGDRAGEVSGHVGDDQIYHASLAPSAYLVLLESCGMTLDAFVVADPDCRGSTVLLAHRR